MVKKIDDWKSFNSIDSSANIRKYLELCENWFINHDLTNSSYSQFYNIQFNHSKNSTTHIGMYENEIRICNEFKCTICNDISHMGTNGKSIVANPFTRAQFMLLCNNNSIPILSLVLNFFIHSPF